MLAHPTKPRYPNRSATLAILILLLVAACTPTPQATAPASQPITVQDALDRTVTLDGPPQRMVIAGRANFMLNDSIYAFPTAPERVVALTQARQTTVPFLSYLEPDFEDKLRLTLESTAEEIAATQPDLVFLKQMMKASVGDALETIGIPVVYLSLETPAEYERDLAILGQIFANPERAATIQRFYDTRVDRIEAGLTGLDAAARPSVLVIQTTAQDAGFTFEVPPTGWIQTQMVELAGGTPVWTEASQGGWAVVGLEQIAAWDPDAIFVISYFQPVDDVVARLTADATWQGLTAVQEGRLFGFPGDFYSWDQPDTRWILGLTWMATRLHPDRFTEIDLRAELDAFYIELYSLDAETIEAEIMPLLVGDIAQ
jgi:iron complex transport system substrate-binding protein